MKTEGERAALSYRWLVFGLLACGYILVFFHRLSTNVVALDMMADLQISGSLVGLLASGYFYPYAFMQLPSGLLADFFGPRRTVTFSFILAGGASILLGAVTSVGWAIAARVLVGVGVSMLFVATLKILTNWFKPAEFSRVTGLLVALGGVGVLIAATPLAYLSSRIGWRGSFIAIGVATLLVAALIWSFVRDTPQDKGFPPLETAVAAADGGCRSGGCLAGIGTVISSRAFWPLAIWFFFTCGVFFSFAGLWGAPYLMQVYGMTKMEAGRVMDLLAYGIIIGSPLLSLASERFRSRKVILVFSSLLLLLLTVPLAFFPELLSRTLLYPLVFLLSLSGSSVVAVAFTMTKELFPAELAGTAVGLVNLFPFLGGALMQPLVGYLLQTRVAAGADFAAAYGGAFQIFFAAALISLTASVLLRESFGGKGRAGPE
ncbi:MAG: MFS transporter [Desulfuromonadaceae bacterium]|nr:MFS transporter [Desulfuromonadaceae bacterium]